MLYLYRYKIHGGHTVEARQSTAACISKAAACREAVTAVALAPDDTAAWSVAKDGSIFQLDIESLKR